MVTRNLLIDVQGARVWQEVTTPGFYAASQLVAGAGTQSLTLTAVSSGTIISNGQNLGGGRSLGRAGEIVRISATVASGSTSGSSNVFVNVRKGTSYYMPGQPLGLAPILHSFNFSGSRSYNFNFVPFVQYGNNEYVYFDVGTSGRTARGLTITVTYYEG